jgi:peptide/nickel transport system substrate-binding protein
MRGRLAAVLAAVALVAAAGCGSDGPAPAPGGGTLVVAEDQVPAILNPILVEGISITGQRIASNVLQNLLTVDETGAYVPQLAEVVPAGADVVEGPLRVTFRIRPEARWSDGRPVTSRDVVFTWRTMTDPDVPVASRSGWAEIRAITPGRTAAGGQCPPATCLTVAFAGDYAPWREVFSVSGGNYVLPRHVLAGADVGTVWNDGGMLGSGPFVLADVQPRVRAVLDADPDWWGAGDRGEHGVGRIVVDFLQTSGAALTALRQGQADLVSPPPDPALIRRARGIDGVEVQSVPSVFFEHLILNTERFPLDEPAVRRALAHAIDRDQIVGVLLEGGVPVLDSVLRPFQLGYAPAFARYRYDPRAASRELEGAGWTRGPDGIYAKGGRALEVPLITTSEGELRRSTARLIAEQARAAGIRVVPRPLPADRVYSGEVLGSDDYAAVMLAFGGPVDPSVTGLLDSSQIPSEGNGFTGQNVYRWSDPEADRLMRLSDRQIDEDARAATLERVQEIVAEEVPLIPLYQQPNTVAYVEGLEGVRQNPSQAEVFWNSGDWTLAP